ncbi:hypothetical protein D3227_25680 [Mesorhizobium waimense]|uniref:Uncharacterized protein n=1 Tax=Mesorhizobium waimense TaxID=1300307 RepID=A0A3A5KJN0_9HYPH|nr:hypothetical protein D3227_25680 [Mesorhizobium waimense]
MLVRLLVGLSGSAFSLGPNDEYDFPQDEAIRLISAGFAAPVSEQKIERAVAVPVAEKRGRRGNNVVHANSVGGAN